MDIDDVQIQKEVEAIFVRSHVDTSKLNFDVVNRSVYVDGFFHVFDYAHRHQSDKEGHELQDTGTSQSNAKKLLLFIEQQIRGISQVGGLTMKFQNWRKTSSGWTELGS